MLLSAEERSAMQPCRRETLPARAPPPPCRQDESAFRPGELEALYPQGHPGLYIG